MAAKPPGKKIDKPVPVTRRDEVRRTVSRERFEWRTVLDQPATFTILGIGLLFVVCVSAIMVWAQSQPMASEGQIMLRTFAARIDFQIEDLEGTRIARENAERMAPRVYRERTSYTQSIHAALQGLPKVVWQRNIADLAPEVVQRFELTPEIVDALQSEATEEGEPTTEWLDKVKAFSGQQFYRNPFISSDRWDQEQMQGVAIELHVGGDEDRIVPARRDQLVAVGSDPQDDSQRVRSIDRVLRDMAVSAGFSANVRPAIIACVKSDLQPTFQYDDPATLEKRAYAAEQVETQYVSYKAGHVLYTAGNPLTTQELLLARAEHEQYLEMAPPQVIWGQRAGVAGIAAVIACLLGGSIGFFRKRLARKPFRLFVLALIMIGLLGVTVSLISIMPIAALPIALISALMLGIIVIVAYGPALALTFGSLYSVLLCLTLALPAGYLPLLIGAVGLNVWQVREIRDRNRLLRAGGVTGIGAAAAASFVAFLYRPMTADGFWGALLVDSVGSAGASVFVGIFTLGILSTIERIFDVTTGLTLVELRDPKQPLLRKLLERAPGTWNHSLQVATLAEAAADAIHADSLLTYVGALYHDIGKLNKPAYFVENQSGGENRHARLSPAMSLLIIVGHVKDGIEMAREFGLPRPIRHFIESHHGTTLVEYFYHVAKEKAQIEGGSTGDVAEVEYRYPGPRPQTKEAAILMIADACESAARTMPETSPVRIEQLVRGIGQKRLLDGQFDECDLTLRELHTIEDSIIKSLCAIYHARISYPSESKSEDERDEAQRSGMNGNDRKTKEPPAAQPARPA